jgi:transmembrane 9 superfamily protein 3
MRMFHRASILCFFIIVGFVCGDEKNQRYKDGEEVILWVNKVGPFANPQETYPYYSLPFCQPEKQIESRFEGLGEALQGYELRKSAMDFRFKENVDRKEICSKALSLKESKKFAHAVKKQYWYQLFLDDLPIWGMVGEVVPGQKQDNQEKTEDKLYLYTHLKFIVTYNQDRVIEVNLTSENPVPIDRSESIRFTYSVNWYPTDIAFSKRFDKYLDNNFFEHQIHWFSIFNSFMMVIFLTGLVSMILMRTLRKDYARYSKDDTDLEDEHDVGEESGWKQIHGDVFRSPPHLVIFSALVGTGHQLAVLVGLVICFSLMGTMYEDRGETVTAFLVSYAFLSFIGGYGGGGYYARNEGKHWIQTMLLTASLFPGICFGIAFLLNFIAIGYGSLAAIPVGTMFAVLFIWAFISFPLTLVGTVVGRNWNGTSDNPCRVNPVPRAIPEKRWYLHPVVNVALGGILPFGSIFIEMYFIFTSFWQYKYYYVYGFMLLVYIILIIVSVCVTIVSTYFLLNSEDYRWQWVSFLSSGSTAGYVFLYSVYYFFVKTKMSGFFQTTFYFGYTLMFCIGLGILCGAIGFIGTSMFVKRIYQNVKID